MGGLGVKGMRSGSVGGWAGGVRGRGGGNRTRGGCRAERLPRVPTCTRQPPACTRQPSLGLHTKLAPDEYGGALYESAPESLQLYVHEMIIVFACKL